ncbi:NUDIX domain-containing protein [Candidatus Saccharibacteria bacterium]|nr:NUDIX domain-containing protein [Candidatus Saccharibacteria bacterium]
MRQLRHQITPAVYLIFRDGPKICLLRRFQTGWRDGEYTLPSGHLENRESIIQAAIREAKEEVGAIIRPEDLDFKHVVNRRTEERDHERVDFFFEVNHYQGQLINNEPHKADELGWFDIDKLPADTVPPVAQVMVSIARGEYYSEYNW